MTPAALLVELGAGRHRRGPTMLASAPARALEERLRGAGRRGSGARAPGMGRARRAICRGRTASPRSSGSRPRRRAVVARPGLALALRCCRRRRSRSPAALLRADLPAQRSLAALTAIELRRPAFRCGSRPARRAGSRPAGRWRASTPAATPLAARAGSPPSRRRDATPERGTNPRRTAARGRDRPGAAARARRRPGADRGRAGAGRVRRRGDRQVARPAGRRPGRALGGALDARRLRAALRAGRLPGRLAEPRAPRRAGTCARDRRGARGRAPQRRRRPALRVEFPDAASFAPLRVRAEIGASLEVGSSEFGVAASAGAEAVPPSQRWRRAAGDGNRRRLLGAARLPPGQADAPGRRRGLRPDGRRGRPSGRPRADRQLRLPLRRRAGGALRRQPRPALGRAAGHLAAPLRDRARPRARRRLRLAGRQRRAASASSSATPGSPGTSASTTARRRARRPATRSAAAGRPRDRASRRGGPAGVRPAPLPRADRRGRRPLERLRRRCSPPS